MFNKRALPEEAEVRSSFLETPSPVWNLTHNQASGIPLFNYTFWLTFIIVQLSEILNKSLVIIDSVSI